MLRFYYWDGVLRGESSIWKYLQRDLVLIIIVLPDKSNRTLGCTFLMKHQPPFLVVFLIRYESYPTEGYNFIFPSISSIKKWFRCTNSNPIPNFRPLRIRNANALLVHPWCLPPCRAPRRGAHQGLRDTARQSM